MNIEDIIIPPREIKTEKWQLGSVISHEIQENGIVLIFCSDYRGVKNGEAEILDFRKVRNEFYRLSKLDFEVPLCDLGDVISGRSHQDTHYILQELLSMCHYKNAVPVIIGGSNDLAFSLFSALNFHQKNLNYTQISNIISLANEGEEITEKNFLSRILSSKNFTIKNYHHLGYQKHLNETDSVKSIVAGKEISEKNQWGIKFYLISWVDGEFKVKYETGLLNGSFVQCIVNKFKFADIENEMVYYNSKNYFLGNASGDVYLHVIDLKKMKVYSAHLSVITEGKVSLDLTQNIDVPMIKTFFVSYFRRDYPNLRIVEKAL